jgi:hypothetical protein
MTQNQNNNPQAPAPALRVLNRLDRSELDFFDLAFRDHTEYFRGGLGLRCNVEIADLRGDGIDIVRRERDISKSLLGN